MYKVCYQIKDNSYSAFFKWFKTLDEAYEFSKTVNLLEIKYSGK